MLPAPAPLRLCARRISTRGRLLLLSFMLLATTALSGCNANLPRNHWWQFWRPKATETGKVYNPDTVVLPPPPDVAGDNPGGSSLPRPPAPGTISEPDTIRQAPRGAVSQLQTVYFDYDSATLTASATATLDQNAQWLQQNPGNDIQIEGHTDERGTAEYNLNLGDRRAKAVKEYLMGKGISGDHLHTISYGAERPIDTSHSESGFSKNRRAQFLLY